MLLCDLGIIAFPFWQPVFLRQGCKIGLEQAGFCGLRLVAAVGRRGAEKKGSP